MDTGFCQCNRARTRRFRCGWQDQFAGLAIRRDQFGFAERHKPPFACLSRSAGRYAIHGDHVCAWAGNWIGKRNHRQFALMTM